jgi:hypothetical protein
MIIAVAILKTDSWDECLAKGLVANLRLTDQLGPHPDRSGTGPPEKNGRRHYFDRRITSFAPNYQAYVWAVRLWVYHRDCFPLFLERTKSGLGTMRELHPKGRMGGWERRRRLYKFAKSGCCCLLRGWCVWRTWHNIGIGRGRFPKTCYPYTTPAGRPAKRGRFLSPPRPLPPPTRLVAQPRVVSSRKTAILLRTFSIMMNFAFRGLHEAAAATGNRYYKDVEDQAVNFPCRVQVTSEEHPEVGWCLAPIV